MTIQIGEQWAYREPPHTPGKAAIAAEVLQFGPPKSNKVRIRLLAGEYPGLDIWAPKKRLLVPWEAVDAYLEDERRYEAAAAASRHVFDTVEYHAAWAALYADPRPDGIHMGYDSANAGVATITDPDEVCRDLSLEREELFADPLAYVGRSGEYVGPWPVTLRLAHRVAEVYPELVLDHIREKEREIEEAATWGKEIQWGRKDPPVYVPAERYVEELHRQQPIFALVRTWCSQEATTRFDEAAALRSEVERLRALVLEAARWLKDSGHPNVARRMRKEVGVEPEPRARTRG